MGFVPPKLAPRDAFKTVDEWYQYNKIELDKMQATIPTVRHGLLTVFSVLAIVSMVYIFFS